MTRYHVYSLANGLLTGDTVTVPARAAAKNTPPNCGLVADVADWLSQRVDLATGQLVDYQPPAPANTSWATWAWDSTARRWVSTPTHAAAVRDVVAPLQARINALEATQGRAAREVAMALAASLPAPAVAVQRLQDVEASIAPLRALINAATSAADAPALAIVSASAQAALSQPLS